MKITKKEIIKMIDAYLNGKKKKKEVAQWAISIIQRECFTVDEILIEDALTTLTGLHDENDRWDTAPEDLKQYKAYLQGKKPYPVKLEIFNALLK